MGMPIPDDKAYENEIGHKKAGDRDHRSAFNRIEMWDNWGKVNMYDTVRGGSDEGKHRADHISGMKTWSFSIVYRKTVKNCKSD